MVRPSGECDNLRYLTRVVTVLVLVGGCNGGRREPGSVPSAGSAAPATWLPITSATMQSGFARGSLRQQQTLPAYEIGKNPVTWGQFNACVQAGHCAKPDATGCSAESYGGYPGYRRLPYDQNADGGPATCVGESQAESYCESIGGRLPTLDEWLLAARGPAPTRFSWGDSATTSDQHPLAADLIARQAGDYRSTSGAGPEPADIAPATELAVGQHPAGASPSGIEDVLLTRGELLGADVAGQFNACATPRSHCVVYGLDPGAIDSVAPIYRRPKDQGSGGASTVVTHAYGFRCVRALSNEVAP